MGCGDRCGSLEWRCVSVLSATVVIGGGSIVLVGVSLLSGALYRMCFVVILLVVS